MSVHAQTVHPRLARHNAKFEPSIRTVAGRYHVAYGFSPSNCTLIEGDEGCVLVDTLPTVEFAEPVVEAFRRITDKHEWLGEFYGSYKHSAPAIYAGYVGWFDGDPATLDPPPRQERAARYVALMGGRQTALDEAAKALHDGDFQWSAELTGWPVAADTGDREARSLRADALRRWGLAQANANWRNWALTAALELEDRLKPPRGLPFGQPDTVRTFPMSRMIETMTVRLKAEAALDRHVTVVFETTDTDEACALEVRRGVCRFHADPPENADIRLRFSRSFLESTVTGGADFPAGVAAGKVMAAGDTAAIDAFFALFETPTLEIPIAVR